ncbi:hypothetical protein RJT34_09767 [Clitoria ternatea]|uniref:TLC domain-containing protein n=1 Tax=Clitoria ternatea TaxID=43366 RepID=A0AAN9K7A3_CLITE
MGGEKRSTVEAFFFAALLLWLFSVCLEIFLNKRTKFLFIIAGSIFYQTSNSLIRFFSKLKDPLFVSTSVSLLHASITSASVIFILFKELLSNGSSGMFEHSQLVEGTWPWAFEALSFSCGYFAYDQLDMLRSRLYTGWIPPILLHHLLLLICFTLALYRNVTINYLILTLICELHSIFLHVRKVRRMAGFRDGNSILIKFEWCLHWLTFFLARFASHILITAKLIRDAHKFRKGVELPLALIGMAGMNMLNIGLGIGLFKAFKRERKSQQGNQHHHRE